MKTIIRSCAVSLVLAGLIATCRAQPHNKPWLLEYKANTSMMPIPVCPPNDPEACHIEKW